MNDRLSEPPAAAPDRVEPAHEPVEIIVMAPLHRHKSHVVWTPAKIAAVVLAAVLGGSGLWWWGNDLYWQYQDEMLAEQLAKEARQAKMAQEQQKIQQAWQAHIEQQRQLRNMRLKEAEDAHIAWDNYYKAQAAAKAQKE